ncbi:MFS transporter [Vibrio tasmaniensis]|uniref:MFS transporter n=1 Tax=Vibrio tasmaniensis TaxID=212663 RepID=UPI00107F3F5C|nr:MFS transporter [Vibrio tasmaniensis]
MYQKFSFSFNVPKQVILFFAVLLQACLGGTYSWSVYDAVFIKQYDVPAALASAPFNLFYVVFPIMLLLASKLIDRFGPRQCAILGGALFGCGWMLASLGAHNFYYILAGVGVLSGLGVGIAYLIPITVGVAWYPEQRGLVTGLAVAGFAGGAALVSQLAQYFLTAGVSPYELLGGVGVGYIFIAIFSGLFMSYPAIMASGSTGKVRLISVVQGRLFQTLFFAMTAGLTAGFFINSKLALLSNDYGIELIISAVAMFALSNAVGRVVWGYLSDKWLPSKAIKLNLFIQALVLSISPLLLQSNFGTAFLAVVTGFNYGGVLVLYASTVGYYWGNNEMKNVYAVLFLSNILAALINIVLGILYSSIGLNIPIVSVLLLLGIAYVLTGQYLKIKASATPPAMANDAQ